MKKVLLITLLITIITTHSFAQVAINESGTSPNSSAMLDVSSTNKGILVPRMTVAERNTITSPANGLLVFIIDDDKFYYNQGTASSPIWATMDGSTDADWTISGNNMYSAVSGNVGIGTTNPSHKLQIRNGNMQLISQGADAYIKLSSDEDEDITPAYIWSENAKGFAVGSTHGSPQLLVNASTGKVGIGTTTPSQKLSIRDGNMSMVSEGSDSFIFLGSDELGDAIGSYLWTDDNVGFAIGSTEGVPQFVVKNENGNVGIGTTSPGARLEVAGQIKITGGNPGSGKVLTSDADGVSTWSSPTVYAASINDLTDAIADAADVFLGEDAGINNNGLNFNTGVGIQALEYNTTGISNTTTGYGAMQKNTTGYENTSMGQFALQNNTTGNYNVAVGKEALLNNTTTSNITAIGYQSLYWNGNGSSHPSQSIENTALGSKSLYSNTLGSQNTAMGMEALKANSTGNGNTSLGAYALESNTEGDHNTATGTFALTNSTTADNNASFGYKSSYNVISGGYNSAFGSLALYATTTGTHNTAMGYTSLFKNTTGVKNTAIGVKTLYNNTTGDRNIAIGNFALYKSDTTSCNIAIGDSTLYNTGTALTGSPNAEAAYNVALGQAALKSNTTGYINIGIGLRALHNNLSGYSNIAMGYSSLYHNTIGYDNIAMGYGALYYNTEGENCIALGYNALLANTDGDDNIAIGSWTTSKLATGHYNTAVGENALYDLTSGNGNVAAGSSALYSLTTGDNNTAIGYLAGCIPGSYNNSTAIGYVAVTTANNQVRIGNSSVTSIGGDVSWTTLSDGRFKENIKEDVAGLDFVLSLRPVSYTVNKQAFNMFVGVEDKGYSRTSSQRECGFVAQEVEDLINIMGVEFNGVDTPDNDDDYYGIRYSQFVVPLVKGMQEQQQQIVKLEEENTRLMIRLEKLEQLILNK